MSSTNETVTFGQWDGFLDDFLWGMWFDEPTPTPTPKSKTETIDEPVETKSESNDIADAIRIKTGYDIDEIKGTTDAVIIRKSDPVDRPSAPRRGGTVGDRRPQSQWSRNTNSWPSWARPSFQTGTISARSQIKSQAPVRTPGTSPADPAKKFSYVASTDPTRRNPTPARWWYKSPTQVSTPVPKAKPKATSEDYKVSNTLTLKEEIILPEQITVKEFSEKLWVPIGELIKKFIANKMMLSLNSTIDFDTASLISEEFGVKVNKEKAKIEMQDVLEWNLELIIEADKTSEFKQVRPPIVTVMWHVDHGKTTLLDYIRSTQITNKEQWGITQSIGGSQIVVNHKKITFIDTPGHELFTSLRARGSKITDIVIIVIAADDGIMLQTVEAINHAKMANVPIIVAITKIDKWVDNSDRIKTQMSEHGLTPEEWGWDVPIIKVSGKTGQWVDELLEMVLLYAEMKELVCDPQRMGVGVVLEAHKDTQKWVIANMIVMTGTIHVGDILWIHNTYGRIKKIYDWKGKELKKATGWDPIMVLGMQDVPEPGRLVEEVKSDKVARERIAHVVEIETQEKHQSLAATLMNRINQWDKVMINLVVRADSWGSLEALKYSVSSLEMPENIELRIVHSDIGNFSESDLDLARASGSLMIGFNNTITMNLKKKAEQHKLVLKSFDIIYELTDYLSEFAKGKVVIELKEVEIGKLETLAIFFRKGSDTIMWGKVTQGEIRNGAHFRIMRSEEEILSGKITSLQKDQTSVDKLGAGHECGMKVKIGKKIEVGDVLELFVME
jgi:translation initiation factor IF-2